MRLNKPTKMIYTPERRIPVGEAVKKSDGTYALRVKKPNENKYDEIPLDALCSSVVLNAEKEPSIDREPPQRRRSSSTINSSI